MLTFKIQYEDDEVVKYEYHPEDRKEFGVISVNKKSLEMKQEQAAYEDDVHDSFFSSMMFSKIRKFIKSGTYRKEGMVAWY